MLKGMIMTIIKTNSYHLLNTDVSGTMLHALHINLMKYSDYPHQRGKKLRQSTWSKESNLDGEVGAPQPFTMAAI